MAGRPGSLPFPRSATFDPLPFELPAPPPLPGHILPEVAVPCAEPFDDSEWLYTVDWDGTRALLFMDGAGGVRLQGEMLDDVTPRFPELTGAGGAHPGSAVLDGVIAVLDAEGRPDLAALGRRLVGGGAAAARNPVVFLAFDVLHLDGASTLRWPLSRRLEALGAISGASESLQVPEHVRGRGTALADAAAARNLAGLVARRASAPYRPGVASPDRLRIALRAQITLVIAGLAPGARGARTLVLAEFCDGRIVHAADVPGPEDPATVAWLEARAQRLHAQSATLPGVFRSGTSWLRPGLTATVWHAGHPADRRVVEPSLIAVRDDVDPRWCIRRVPVPPPVVPGSAGRFAPTVLDALPLGDAALLGRPR